VIEAGLGVGEASFVEHWIYAFSDQFIIAKRGLFLPSEGSHHQSKVQRRVKEASVVDVPLDVQKRE
jgi:hypothetical protein